MAEYKIVGGKIVKVRKRRTSNLILGLLGAFLLLFIICMIWLFWVKGSVPDTLITCVLGAGGVEAFVMAGIKISKVLKGDVPSQSDLQGEPLDRDE